MWKSMILLSLPMIFAAAFIGCGSSEPAPPNPVDMQADLMRAWLELPKAGSANLDVGSASIIAQRLAESGPEGLTPLLDVLGDPQGDPVAKVLVVISLTPLVSPAMAPRLIEFTQESQETTTRACAANLLAKLDLPEALGRMRELCRDKEQRVRVAAQLAMISRRDPEQIGQITALWQDPMTNPAQRTQLILVLPDTNEQDYLSIFSEAVVNQELESVARKRAAAVLGRLGDTSALAPLERCAGSDPDPEVVSLASTAIEAVKARMAAEPNPAPVSPPPNS